MKKRINSASIYYNTLIERTWIAFGALLFFCVQAHAQYQIQQIDPSVPIDRLKIQGVEAHTVDELNSNILPNLVVQDGIIAEARLNQETKNWDQLERDLFFIRASDDKLSNQIYTLYPNISSEKLSSFKRLIKSSRSHLQNK